MFRSLVVGPWALAPWFLGTWSLGSLGAQVPRAQIPRSRCLGPWSLGPWSLCQGGRIENWGTDQGIPGGTSRDPVSECQDLYADETMSQLEKMESLLPYIQRWIQNEPQNPLKRSFLPNDETTFGQIKARLMVLCTCTVDDDKAAAYSKEIFFGIAQALASTTSFMKSL